MAEFDADDFRDWGGELIREFMFAVRRMPDPKESEIEAKAKRLTETLISGLRPKTAAEIIADRRRLLEGKDALIASGIATAKDFERIERDFGQPGSIDNPLPGQG